ncbi:sensor histidine kinase [Micromonospora yangpuensis]|uniref:sensor histidine kinase n=1 Tax=Micromonospora yangpuensis TaxID=683228 RepID=UPI0019AB8EEA|nr:sensor histidine kinase [Micromonospora yangpuensis]GGM01460.1 hypothetical protein GCM10012279_18800 [Micromonospora yangpuensis]
MTFGIRPVGALRLTYEVVLALAFCALAPIAPLVYDSGPLPAPVAAVLATVTAAVVVPLRLVRPLTALLCAATVGVVVGDGGGLLVVMLCFSAGYRLRHLGRSLLALLLVACCWVATAVQLNVVGDLVDLVLTAAFFVPTHLVPALVGWAVGRRRRVVGAMHWRNVQLHSQQVAVARQARTRERNRIARDLHDSLGHRLTLISLYAGTLPAATGAQRDEHVALLRSTATDAMADLRQILGVLGQEEDGEEVGVAQPLDSLDALADSARSTGATFSLTRSGTSRPLPPLIEHAAYRVVQEGVTNALRHARGGPIDVALRYEPDTLVVEVVNGPGASHPGPTSGQGLLGLGERVRLAGGVLHHGTTTGTGFRLAAMLPYRVLAPESTADPHPGPAAVPGMDAAGDFDLLVRRSAHRSRIALITLTVAITAVLGCCGAAVFFVATAPPTTVAADQFAAVRIGQPETDVRQVLPPPAHAVDDETTEPPPPAATCVTYLAPLSEQVRSGEQVVLYRFCFRAGALVEKRELRE